MRRRGEGGGKRRTKDRGKSESKHFSFGFAHKVTSLATVVTKSGSRAAVPSPGRPRKRQKTERPKLDHLGVPRT